MAFNFGNKKLDINVPLKGKNLDLDRIDNLINKLDKLARKTKLGDKKEIQIENEEIILESQVNKELINKIELLLQNLQKSKVDLAKLNQILKEARDLVNRNPQKAKELLDTALNLIENSLVFYVNEIKSLEEIEEEESKLSYADYEIIGRNIKEYSKTIKDLQKIISEINQIEKEEKKVINLINGVLKELNQFIERIEKAKSGELDLKTISYEIKELNRLIKEIKNIAIDTINEDKKILTKYYLTFLDKFLTEYLGVYSDSDLQLKKEIAYIVNIIKKNKIKPDIKKTKALYNLLQLMFNLHLPVKVSVYYTIDLINNKTEGWLSIYYQGNKGNQQGVRLSNESFNGIMLETFATILKDTKRILKESVTAEYLEVIDTLMETYDKSLEMLAKLETQINKKV